MDSVSNGGNGHQPMICSRVPSGEQGGRLTGSNPEKGMVPRYLKGVENCRCKDRFHSLRVEE